MTTTTKTRKPAAPVQTLAEKVDELGALKAAIAELEKREKALKADLIASGEDAIIGMLYQASVLDSVRWTLDSDAIKAEMSEAWVTKHSKCTRVCTVRVSARS